MFTRSTADLVRCGGARHHLALITVAGIACVAGFGGAAHAQSVQVGPLVNPTNGNSYYLLHGTSDWFRFQTFARSIGGDLVTIDDAAEQAWLHANVGEGYAYIGINDSTAEGTFAWSSGAPVGFTFWDELAFGDPEPDDFGFMSLIPELGGSWLLASNGQWSHAIAELSASEVCRSATPLVFDRPVPGTTAQASLDLNERVMCDMGTDGYAGPALWYRFTGDGRVVNVTMCSPATTSDTVLYVFKGPCGALECIDTSDDDPCGLDNPSTSSVEFVTECAVEYFVAVKTYQHDGGGYESGPFVLTVETVSSGAWLTPAIFSLPSGGGVFFVTSPVHPFEAQEFAHSVGAELATISSPPMNDELRAALAEFIKPPAILGLSSCGGSEFAWLSGDPVTYTNWAPGEPFEGPEAMAAFLDGDGTWFSAASAAEAPAVIEFRNDFCEHAVPLDIAVSVPQMNNYGTQQPIETPCGDVVGGGTWYRFEGLGTNVTIGVWPSGPGVGLGATIRLFEGTCTDKTCLAGAADNEAQGEATQLTFYAESGRNYLILVSASSADGVYTVTAQQSAPTLPAVIAHGAVESDECARYMLIDNTDWSRCEDVARAYGLDLVSIADDATNERVRAFAAANIPAKGSQQIWLGLTDRDAEGEFAWIDGLLPAYTNWADAQPDNAFGIQDYAVMSTDDGEWRDEHRNSGAYGVARVPLTTNVGGVIRGCLDLSGDSSSIALNSSQVQWPSGYSTIECWIRTQAPGVILSQMGSEGSFVPVLYVGVDGTIRGAAWAGSVEASVVHGAFVGDGQWHHVALTHDGPMMSIAVDGEVVDQIEITVVDYSINYWYVIGYGQWSEYPATFGDYGDFNGQIDEFRAWTIGRNPAQVRATMTTRFFNPSLYPNLDVHYSFDEGGGHLLHDGVSAELNWAVGDIAWAYEDRDADGRTDLCHPLCEADIDGNGVVNSTDVSEFINLWFADQAFGTLNADFNRSGVSNSTDVSDYINAWFETTTFGCG